MIKLQNTNITISYNRKDIKSIEQLINDIAETVKEKLLEEVNKKPFKCNVEINYSSAYGNIKGKGLGLKRKQS